MNGHDIYFSIQKNTKNLKINFIWEKKLHLKKASIEKKSPMCITTYTDVNSGVPGYNFVACAPVNYTSSTCKMLALLVYDIL